MAVKSLVWVPKGPWEDAGYTTDPKSVQELESIGDEIKADGIAPWCIGIEDGGATGWVGTDWIEEYMLRVNGPEVYDQWVKHEIPFNDPQVKAAFDAFQDLLGDDDENAFGGRKGITTTSFKTTGNDAFTDPPKCMMQRQGNFITGFWPEDVQADIPASVDVMPFPAYEGGYDGTPVLGGGDLAAAFHGDDEDVQEVMTFLTSDQFGKEWAAAGGWLSPHKTFDLENYSDPTTKAVAEVAVNADVFRFDGSDLMPGEVGAGHVLAGHDRLVRRRVDRQGAGRHRSAPGRSPSTRSGRCAAHSVAPHTDRHNHDHCSTVDLPRVGSMTTPDTDVPDVVPPRTSGSETERLTRSTPPIPRSCSLVRSGSRSSIVVLLNGSIILRD